METVATTASFTESEAQACPSCYATVPIHFGYTIWCDQCGWNLQAEEPDPPRNVFEKLYLSLGRRLGQGLFEEVLRTEVLKPRPTLSKALAFAIAAVVHLVTLGFVFVGAVLLIRGAIDSLIAWHQTLRPTTIVIYQNSIIGSAI